MSSQNNAVVEFTAQPKSSRSKIVLDGEGRIKVYLNSPPVDGKANEECIRLFSEMLRVPKSRISIDRGEKGRKKRVLIEGTSLQEVMDTISQK